jgi:hypothetical protein
MSLHPQTTQHRRSTCTLHASINITHAHFQPYITPTYKSITHDNPTATHDTNLHTATINSINNATLCRKQRFKHRSNTFTLHSQLASYTASDTRNNSTLDAKTTAPTANPAGSIDILKRAAPSTTAATRRTTAERHTLPPLSKDCSSKNNEQRERTRTKASNNGETTRYHPHLLELESVSPTIATSLRHYEAALPTPSRNVQQSQQI